MARPQRLKPRYKWQPLQRAYTSGQHSEEFIQVAMRDGISREAAIKNLADYDNSCECWRNDIYQVQVRHYDSGLVHLNIRRRDGAPILRDWRHFQQIKNELVGEECEAIELYPAESRKVDTSNKYHLYAYADPTFRFPVGMPTRDVDYEGGDAPGLRQRPL